MTAFSRRLAHGAGELDILLRAVGRKNLNAIVFSLSVRLLLLEKEPGGADASVARVVDCSLF
jgi:hypothetical protein